MEEVDQLLFGYREGHELVAGSCELAPAALLELLPHVDASFEPGEECQLVGTWIASLERYMLARIWPAPEQPRHGAVWAHALLLSGTQLEVARCVGLPGLLRRPTADAIGGYGHRLAWPQRAHLSPTPSPLVHALSVAACATDGLPRVVLWPAPAEAEGALVALLDVLPHGSRRAMSFRTRERARSGRSPYRVQVGADLRGRPDAGADLVIDAREALVAADPWSRA